MSDISSPNAFWKQLVAERGSASSHAVFVCSTKSCKFRVVVRLERGRKCIFWNEKHQGFVYKGRVGKEFLWERDVYDSGNPEEKKVHGEPSFPLNDPYLL